MTTHFQHTTVLLNEAVEGLRIKKNGLYVDGTFGRGGHSQKILEQLGSDGVLVVIDKDPEAIALANAMSKDDHRIQVWQGAFSQFPDALKELDVKGKIDGILLDLGVSSPQLDDASRGFSFLRDGALDMRMNPEKGQSAAEWLSHAEEKDIADVLWQFGEERFSRQIAKAIVKKREELPLQTTLDLSELIGQVVYKREPGKNPATRSFQAIRIYINGELSEVTECLDQSLKYLAPEGRLVVISFHSLEDRIVKRFLRDHSRPPKLPKGLPVMSEQHQPPFRLVGKAVKASSEEIEINPRSRSAIMRIGERVK